MTTRWIAAKGKDFVNVLGDNKTVFLGCDLHYYRVKKNPIYQPVPIVINHDMYVQNVQRFY